MPRNEPNLIHPCDRMHGNSANISFSKDVSDCNKLIQMEEKGLDQSANRDLDKVSGSIFPDIANKAASNDMNVGAQPQDLL